MDGEGAGDTGKDSTVRRWLLAGAWALALCQAGCVFFVSDGGGPLRRSELGDWAGMAEKAKPSPAELEALIADLKTVPNQTLLGKFSLRGDASVFATNFNELLDVPFSPAPGLRIKGRLNPWLRFVPGPQHGDWFYFDEAKPAARQFYASEDEWDVLVGWGERVDCWDVATGERVGARGVISIPGFGLGWARVRKVRPVDRSGVPGLDALAYSKQPVSEALYDIRDGTSLLLGAVAWGRVNRTRYLQILWIPIPVGRAGP